MEGACYKAMEFCGEAIEGLSMDGRLTMANMAIEAGGKCGYVQPDRITEDYLAGRTDHPYSPVYSDPDAVYEQVFAFDVGELDPQVAFPHSPANARPVQEAAGIAIDQVVIGSCTNGRLRSEDSCPDPEGERVHPGIA